MKKQLLLSSLLLLFLISGTILAVLFANGYRINLSGGKPNIAKTGILNASSNPKGAQVWINDHLTSATNNAINLAPGKYTVKFSKEGYADWQKDVIINAQLVTNADALLYPVAPALQSISTIGVESPVMDPSGTKLAFRIASQSAKRNGIYVLDMTTRTFPVLALQSSSTQLVDDTSDIFSASKLSWSPDGQQILASVSARTGTTNYLLQANTFNESPRDVTAVLASIEAQWVSQVREKERVRMEALIPSLKKIISNNFKIISFSPDDNKILYEASESAELPIVITPRRIGNNPLYEMRNIKKGGIYVYDITEDINTKIIDTPPASACDIAITSCTYPLTWFPDSKHLIFVDDKQIKIVENDGSNMTTVYAGPFIEPYVYPWPDGSKIVIITNLNNLTIPPTLYTIGLK